MVNRYLHAKFQIPNFSLALIVADIRGYLLT